jgi:hypothetical protein
MDPSQLTTGIVGAISERRGQIEATAREESVEEKS